LNDARCRHDTGSAWLFATRLSVVALRLHLPDERCSGMNALYTQFFAAIRSGDLATYQALVSEIDDLDVGDDDLVNGVSADWTALHYAASAGNPAIVEDLLRRKAKRHLRTKGDESLTPLELAAIRKDTRIFTLLLAAAKKPALGTLAHVVSREWPEGVEMVLAAGADVNERSRKWKDTPLICATQNNDRATTRVLLARGADPFLSNQMKDHAVDIAIYREYLEIIGLLVQGVPPVRWRGGSGHPLLHVAIGSAHPASAQALLDLGAPPDEVDVQGRTPKERCAEVTAQLTQPAKIEAMQRLSARL
jgi:ankyrin repeat protein